MKFENYMILEFPSRSSNEAFARSAVACFAAQLDPTLEELGDIKTAVSEAVTNCIVHAYEGKVEKVLIECQVEGNQMELTVKDYGCGIEDVKKAMEPLFTTKPQEERAGMGFAFMEAFMDDVAVESEPGKGTTVRMKKKIEHPAGKFAL